MFGIDIDKIINNLYLSITLNIELYAQKLIGALLVILFGIFISIGIYKLIIYLFKKFKITQLIDKLNVDFDGNENEEKNAEENKKNIKRKKISDKIKIDDIVGKAISYYVFLIFFRYSIVVIGIREVEDFLAELIAYLPSLFIAIIIGFFGVRFANFIYDIVFHALELTKQKTAKIIASGAKVIILFFTLMVVLSKIGIATEITNTILIGFISMLALAGGLAFGLGGKDIAHEILESFRK